MARIRTHYDNLKVARDAPSEVIRAAYRSLSKKYHPDKNLSSGESDRVMAIVNTSYEVLSDPIRRAQHDRWIAAQESGESSLGRESPVRSKGSGESGEHWIVVFLFHVLKYWMVYSVLCFVLYFSIFDEPSRSRSELKPYRQTPPPLERKDWIKPTLAPNGYSWPSSPDYVEGYEILHSNGLSEVTIDNTQNDSDVFVKLVSLVGESAYPVRQFYISASQSFTLKEIRSGLYDIRYRDLDTGGLSRSEPFFLIQTNKIDGVEYSTISMTLYKVIDGNMQSFALSESDF